MIVWAVRAAVFMAEQACPYSEEFDGNDHCAIHFIGFSAGEPAATLRIRIFGDFAKLERFAVIARFRDGGAGRATVARAMEYLRRKGVKRVHGHAKLGLERYWSYVTRRYGGGFKPVEGVGQVAFSGLSFVPMGLDPPGSDDRLTELTSAQTLNRPEDEWDVPGILEHGGSASGA